MTDPFDALRLPTAPVAPDPAFATRLRTRLVDTLGPPPDPVPTVTLRGTDPADPADPTAASFAGGGALVPYIAVEGAAAALDWYRDVLGAIELNRFVEPDGGRVGHAEIAIGGSRLMISDAYPEAGVVSPATQEGSSTALQLDVVDVDHTYRRAVDAGATVLREPTDQFHGNRNAVILDPWGHRWMLSQPIDAARAEAAADADPGDFGDVRRYSITGRRPVEPGYLTMATGDLARARAFFTTVFDWDVEAGSEHGGGHVANTRFPLGFMEGDAPASGPVTLYFRVDDIDVYAERVEAAGGRVLARHEYPSGGNAECVDDQGFRFDLFQPAPGY
ncbi:MAG: hypothetical protein GXY13_09115 [Acidimicrobiales bacterium]|nr:hypothetical protein [Acidimicrobiales bacterium]